MDHSDEDNAEDSNVYVMSSEVGSLRYMSPEVANGEKYNHKVDTYAFGEIDSFPIFTFWKITSNLLYARTHYPNN